jgi:hypothetical protein
MNELPAELRLYRDQLRDAVARDLGRRGSRYPIPRPSLRVAVPALVGVAAVIAAVVVVVTAGSRAQSADAAILHRMAAALTPPAGTILHERAEITSPTEGTQPFEIWMQADSPHAYRVIKWGHEGSWNGSSFSSYDAASNTITTSAGSSPEPVDFAATLRSLVQSGQATIDGTTTINGVPAYKLAVASSPDPWLIGTAYVATGDYHPLEIDTITNSERIVYQTYDYLPSTAANLRLLDLNAHHPSATVVGGAASTTSTTSTTP